MASELKIDHIEQDGERYEFYDKVARDNAAKAIDRVSKISEDFSSLVNEEKERAMLAEAAIERSKISKVEGKGLSTNDFTDEYKEMVENPPAFKGATESRNGESGTVPAPSKGDQQKFLRADGNWVVPTDTTYEDATELTHGLMSASDKEKLNKIEAEPDEFQSSNTIFNGNTITETLGNGRTKQTTFNDDGSITQVISKSGVETITLNTVFNSDGSIVRTRS